MITIHWFWLALAAGVIWFLGFATAELWAAFRKGGRHIEYRRLVPGSTADRLAKQAVRDEEEAVGII